MTTFDQVPITIGIPFYNAEDTLLDAIRSVFAQRHQRWELILLDDGSTDRSLEIARSIDDPRVRVYSDGENKRLAARLNQMTRLARFEYLARMDADDLMSPFRLERQLQLLLSSPEVDLVSAGICSLADDYQPVGSRCVALGHLIRPYDLLNGKSGIVHASILGKRDWFKRNPYNENLPKSQDTNLWVRAYARGDLRIVFLPEPLYYYREDGNVTSSKLRLAYQVGRHTILHDAGAGFSFRDRARAFVLCCAKSMAVLVLAGAGRLEAIRNRRNFRELSGPEGRLIAAEIDEIRALKLPLRSSHGGLG